MSRRSWILAGLIAAAAVALGAAALVGGEAPAGRPVGRDGIAWRASFAPRAILFGETVVARLDVLVDRDVLDPNRIELDATFSPFQPAGQTRRRRTDYDRVTRLTYLFPLDCIESACVPEGEKRDYGFRTTTVRHGGKVVARVEWPTVNVSSRLRDPAAQDPTIDPTWRATLGPQAPTYRIDPTLLSSLLLLFALALLVTSVALFARAVPWLPQALQFRRRPKLGPLERALAVLERANVRGIEEEQRLALDRLAVELRTRGAGELAGTAHRLAWAADVPRPERTAALSGDVRDLIAGRANGRP